MSKQCGIDIDVEDVKERGLSAIGKFRGMMLVFRGEDSYGGTWRFPADKAVGVGAMRADVIAARQGGDKGFGHPHGPPKHNNYLKQLGTITTSTIFHAITLYCHYID